MPKTNLTLLSTLTSVVVALAVTGPISTVRAQSSDSTTRDAAGDSFVTGRWIARSRLYAVTGDMTLTLQLTQVGDSVSGFANFENRGLVFRAPTALYGTFKGGRLKLQDRADTFLLEGRVRNGKLDTRLSEGTVRKGESFPAVFTRRER